MRVKFKSSWHRIYPELTPDNVYRVIEIHGEWIRIMDDAGEPLLFPERAFRIEDTHVPSTWFRSVDEDGINRAVPADLSERGLFERFFDYDRDARQRMHRYLHNECWRDAEGPSPNRFFEFRTAAGQVVEKASTDVCGGR